MQEYLVSGGVDPALSCFRIEGIKVNVAFMFYLN